MFDPKKEAIKFGVILGLVQVLVQYCTWAISVDTMINVATVLAFIPFIIITLIVAGLHFRKQNGNILEFKEALKFSFLTYVIIAVITAVATYVLYNLIDKDLTEKSFQIGLDKTRRMMEKVGVSGEQLDEAMEKAEKDKQDTGLKKIILGQGMFLIWDFVKSLIIAAIIRREKKFEFDQNPTV